MKRYLYLLAFCCHFILSQAAPPPTEVDSLKRQLPQMPHDTTRLELIQKLLRLEQTTPNCILFSNMLLQEANLQNRSKYAGIALYFQVIYYYNQNELDSVAQKLDAMEPYVQDGKLWDYFFDGQRCLIDLYTNREQFEYAKNKSLEMQDKATKANNIRGMIGSNQCLANIFMATQQWDKSKEVLMAAHGLLNRIDNIIVKNSVLMQLITFSKSKNAPDELLSFLKEQELNVQNYLIKNPSMVDALQDVLIFNNIYYAYYYAATQQPSQAAIHLQKAAKYLNSNTYFMYRVLYFDADAEYHRLCKNYDQAVASLDSTIILLQDFVSSEYAIQLSTKANVLTEAGRSKEALPIYHQVIQLKDSLQKVLSDKQMVQIQRDYHMEKLELEESQASNKVWSIAFIVILVAILTMLFFTVRIYKVRKALKVAEQETRKATRIAEDANETKNRFLSNMSYNIRIPLNSVVGFSQLIATDSQIDDKTRREFSAIIQKNSEELMRLVNDVLDLSRLEANMMKFQIQEYDVVAICNEAIYMARMNNDGAIEIEFDSEIESQIIVTDTAKLTYAILSTLICTQKVTIPRKIKMMLTHDNKAQVVRLRVANSLLADPDYSSQEVIIRHEINRLLLLHFNGSYVVRTKGSGFSEIDFTYPITTISE